MARDKKEIVKKERRLVRTNPHGVNQYTQPDPRQALFLSYLFNPESETFGRGRTSGLKAGFAEQYAESLTFNSNNKPDWFSKYLEEHPYLDMISKAEENIREILSINHNVQAMGAFGPVYEKVEKKVKGKNGKMKKEITKIPIYKVDSQILKIKESTTHFVLERLKRKEYGKEAPKIGKLNFNFANIKMEGDKYL